jgi:hypothetical protein
MASIAPYSVCCVRPFDQRSDSFHPMLRIVISAMIACEMTQ